jgi:hypothetical protein
MNEEILSINDVIDEIQNWLNNEFPIDMSPSEFREALQKLDDIGMMEFDELCQSYEDLNFLLNETLDFNFHDDEFITKLDEVVTDYIVTLEENNQDDSYGDY